MAKGFRGSLNHSLKQRSVQPYALCHVLLLLCLYVSSPPLYSTSYACCLLSLLNFIYVSSPRCIQVHLSVVFFLYSTSSVCHLPALFNYICLSSSFFIQPHLCVISPRYSSTSARRLPSYSTLPTIVVFFLYSTWSACCLPSLFNFICMSSSSFT